MTVFERFTSAAREVVVTAQAEARELAAPRIDTEHLLLALLAVGGGAGSVLREVGLTPDVVRRQVAVEVARLVDDRQARDAAALEAIGIDLPGVRDRLERTFGPGAWERASSPRPRRRWNPVQRRRAGAPPRGHIPFSPRAKRVLEQSLREALRLRHREIGTEHLLLGLLEQRGGLGAAVLAGRGVAAADLRRRLLVTMSQAA